MSGKRLTEADIARELSGLSPKDSHGDDSVTDLLSKLDPKTRWQVVILQKLIYYRSANAEVANRVINLHWEQLDELASKVGLDREGLAVLTPKEIITLSKTLKLPQDFAERSDRYGIYCLSGEFKVFYEKELDEKLAVFEQKTISNQTELKGTIAFKGKVSGTAKIVENTNDLQKVEEGDIIISPETMPDYIIGMKKAAAFVTNMGGITSHAAIVARELKKPCIIATKFATKVFKDGDMVEVDAEKGIVRKIS